MRTEINLSDHYRKDVIELLTRFCNFTHHKTLKDITREDIIDFLDKLRKPESVDHLHKWIGTYNQYRMHLFRFVKWLYAPNVEYKKRTAPPILENIPHLKRKEISNYKPSDLWTQESFLTKDIAALRLCGKMLGG